MECYITILGCTYNTPEKQGRLYTVRITYSTENSSADSCTNQTVRFLGVFYTIYTVSSARVLHLDKVKIYVCYEIILIISIHKHLDENTQEA